MRDMWAKPRRLRLAILPRPYVSLGLYVRLVLRRSLAFWARGTLATLGGFCKFYLSFMHIVGVGYYVFQRSVFQVFGGPMEGFVSCHIFPLILVDTALKLNLVYCRFEALYLLGNVGFFMCLWSGKVVYVYHFMEYSRGPFWMFVSVFFYMFSFFYNSKVFLFRHLDIFTRAHCFRFFSGRNWLVGKGGGFAGVCESVRPRFLVRVLFG